MCFEPGEERSSRNPEKATEFFEPGDKEGLAWAMRKRDVKDGNCERKREIMGRDEQSCQRKEGTE